MLATVAFAARTRSAGASSISSPRRPPLQNTVPNAIADASTTTGSRLRWPTGAMPPATYPVARSAAATSAITARFPPHGDGERLEVELALHRDHARHQVAIHRRDQRLEHPVRGHPERLAGLPPVRGGARVVLVFVHGERDLRPLQGHRRRRPASRHEGPPYGTENPAENH